MEKKKPNFNRPIFDTKEFESFSVYISQTVPFDLKFGTMVLSEYELLVQTIYLLNKLIDVTNDYTNQINEVLEWLVNEGLQESVLNQLILWKEDGTLDDLINEALFNGKLDKITFEEYKVEQSILNADFTLKLIELEKNKFDKGTFIDLTDYPKLDSDISDSERLNRAIIHLNSIGGGTLHLGYGNFDIHETVGIRSNVSLIGEGVGATRISLTSNVECFKNLVDGRQDYFRLKDMAIRRVISGNKPVLDFEDVSHSFLEGLYVIDFTESLNEGNIGLLMKNRSYYNTIYGCQFVKFYTGIYFQTMANGNTILGGSCIFCVENGVVLDNTDSTKFISHSVELETVNAYKIINGSYYNNFFGCRIEETDYSYVIPYIHDNPSFSNMIIGGLDYSRNKSAITGSNIYIDYSLIYELSSWANASSVLATIFPGNQLSLTDEYQVLNFDRILFDRASNYSDNTFTSKEKCIYEISLNVGTQIEQTNGLDFMVKHNGVKIYYNICGKKNFNLSIHMLLEIGDTLGFEIKSSVNTLVFSGSNQQLSINKV